MTIASNYILHMLDRTFSPRYVCHILLLHLFTHQTNALSKNLFECQGTYVPTLVSGQVLPVNTFHSAKLKRASRLHF